jgi:hypothetical protein
LYEVVPSYDLWPWITFHDGDQLYQVIWPWNWRFSLYSDYKAFLLSNPTTLTFDLHKQKGSSSHDYGSVSIGFAYKAMLGPRLLTLKHNRVLPLMMVNNSTKLYDPGAYGSISILPKRFTYQVMQWTWPLTFKNNSVLPLMMVIKYTKLYDHGAYCSVSILLKISRQTDIWTMIYDNTFRL